DERVLARGGDASAAHALARDDAEVEQHFAQQLFDRQKRIQNQRREDARVELLEKRPAARRLAGADVAREDDEAFLAADGLLQERDGFLVRFAAVEEAWIGCQREWRLYEPVILFVHRCVAWLCGGLGTHARGNSNRPRSYNRAMIALLMLMCLLGLPAVAHSAEAGDPQ